MSDIPVLSNLADVFGPQNLQLYAPNLPQYQNQLTRQLSGQATGDGGDALNAAMSAYPNILPSYADLMNQRVNVQGSAPWTSTEAASAIQAAGQHESVTPEPEGNFFTNIVSDVSTLAHSIPQLPQGIFNEVSQLGTSFSGIPGAISKGTNPIESLGNVAQMPGVRLVPGSFIASQFATGGPGASGLLEHPFFTAMDVLPYASKAAKLSSTVRAAESANLTARELAGAAGLDAPKSLRSPITTWLKNVRPGGPVVEPTRIGGVEGLMVPKIQPNPLGALTDAAKGKVFGEGATNFLGQGYGQGSRDMSQLSNRLSGQAKYPSSFWKDRDPLSFMAAKVRESADEAATKFGLSREQSADLHAALTLDRAGNKSAIDMLPPDMQVVAQEVIRGADDLADGMIAEGMLPPRVPLRTGPNRVVSEVLTHEQVKPINSLRADITSAVDQIRQTYASDPAAMQIAQSNPDVGLALQRLDTHIQNYDWLAAAEEARWLRDNAAARFDPLAVTMGSDKGAIPSLIKAARKLDKLEAKTVSARWMPLVQKEMQSRFTDLIRQGAHDPAISPEVAMDLANARIYGSVFDDATIKAVSKESRQMWRELSEQGYEPQFVHSVTPDQAARLNFAPTVFDHNISVSSLKERMLDASPSVQDPVLALRSQAQELINYRLNQTMIDWLTKNKVRTAADLTQELMPQVREVVARNAGISEKQALNELITKTYAPWDPQSFLSPAASKGVAGLTTTDKLYIPKGLKNVLDDLKTPRQGRLGKAVEPVMKVFRTSVLPLSPRWYMGNAVGGAILAAGQSGNPLTMFKYFRDAWELAKHPHDEITLTAGKMAGEKLSRMDIEHLPPADAALQSEMQYYRSIPGVGRKINTPGLAHDFSKGSTLRKWFTTTKGSDGITLAQKFLEKLTDKGHSFNSFADNFYSTVGYLEGTDRALMKGLSRDEAVRLGVEQGRRVLEVWDTMTPVERGVMRSIFPFYGWTRHLLKYTLQYPATHPTRLSILTNLARAEQADMDSGIPEKLRNIMLIGDPKSDSKILGVNVGGLNPFADIASYASLLGFMAGGQGDLSALTKGMNPLITTAMTTAGVDVTRGLADAYPDLYFDPATGTTKTKSGDLRGNLIKSVMPQMGGLMSLLGLDPEFEKMKRTNPEAAGRTALAQFGVPVYTRSVDMPAERMKYEVTKYRAQQNALTDALKSGDLDSLNRWPDLRPVKDYIDSLPADVRRQFMLGEGAGLGDSIKAATVGPFSG